jgi:hypothetical protein
MNIDIHVNYIYMLLNEYMISLKQIIFYNGGILFYRIHLVKQCFNFERKLK